MGRPADAEGPKGRSAVGDAIGGAAVHSARVVARAWRGPLETAAEEFLSSPEVAQILDRAMAGPLPEQVAQSLVRHRVVERIAEELAASGQLDQLLEQALESPRTLEAVDQALSSEAVRHALERVLSGPELRKALASQSTGLAVQVAGGVRHAAAEADRELSARRGQETTGVFGGVATRGLALLVDALAVVAVTLLAGGAAGLVSNLVGGIRPEWLAALLLGSAWIIIGASYFTLFWSTAGQTPGMRLMHVRVVRDESSGGDLSFGRALVRTLGLALAILPCFLGFLPALFDSRRRALPDYLAGTVVVYD